MIYNDLLYNQALYNSPLDAGIPIGVDLVVFNSFSISDGTYMVVTDVYDDSAPTRELIGGIVPRDDGEYITSDFWRPKFITVEGYIKTSSGETMQAYLDTVKKNLRTREQYLDITKFGYFRRYIASWINPETAFEDRKGYNINVVRFKLTFKCHFPFGTDLDYTSSQEAMSTSPSSLVVTNAGTVHARCKIAFVVDAANTCTVLNITNVTTGEQIQYTGTIAAGDVFIFDGENFTAKKNSSNIDFSGSFPKCEVGSNNFRFTITGTSFSGTGTIAFKNPYL